jgi:1D-myo-inositol 3-kinase
MQFDYTTVGHVTVDVLADGSVSAGGTALYSALQASRLGLRTLIHTRGVVTEIESLLRPFDGEIEAMIEPAPATTTLATSGTGSARRQRILSWAGPIELTNPFESSILHLAPVARELTGSPQPHDGFMGLTPQGLVRGWSGEDARLLPCPPEPLALALAELSDAIVISDQECADCVELISVAARTGGLVAVTAGSEPTTLLLPSGERQEQAITPLAQPMDDIGAGDVYASALFIGLAEGESPLSAAAFAGAAAAVRMLGVGPQAIAGRAAIQARLDRAEQPLSADQSGVD